MKRVCLKVRDCTSCDTSHVTSVVSFNLVRFSKNCEQWRPLLAESTEENCHDAVRWISALVANGNTCTLQALEVTMCSKTMNDTFATWLIYIL